jgi:NAD(P)-dependent dehydrogenase (short-subunit alcohol dehydrogenase family)
MKLTGQVALVTGAGSGIGRATAELLASEGAYICTLDRDLESLNTTLETIQARGGAGEIHSADVREPAEVSSAVAACIESRGAIDILCNIAGIGSTQTVVDTPVETWDAVFDVNVRGVFLLCKAVLPSMIERGSGTIINMASVAGQIGIRNRAAYSASKGAVIALTRAIAIDHIQHGIRCNCVCPGTVDTPWVGRLLQGAEDETAERAALNARQPMGRLGTPEEVAHAVLYLVSPEAAFITGTALVIDGGWTAQ